MTFLHALSISALALSNSGGPATPGTFTLQESEKAPRSSIDLTAGWRFHFGAQSATVTEATFDDSAWDRVSLPHSWNHLGEYMLERSAATNNAQGIGWYRLAFDAPALAKGRRRVIQFDGVGNIAEVWLNGVRLGEHRGAFSRFRFDISQALRPGNNVLVVKADNSKPAVGSSTENVIPLGGDFFIHGGIYRGVSLIEVDGAHIDLLDHGGPGVYASATLAGDAAEVQVVTRLRNAAARKRRLTVVTSILDAAGASVASTTERADLAGGAASELSQRLRVSQPHLWNGRADPYLYQVAVELRDGRRAIDRVVQPLGIRSFSMDADKGFFLNGKHLPLHGVSRHQDRQAKGWALSEADHDEDMALIAEMGANTVRGAHYQHADKWFELADKYGMVVWAEIPFVNAASFGSDPANAELTANAREQLTELIRQNYNHPSVVTWSVGNEVDIGAAFSPTGISRSLSLLKNLNDLAKQEDLTRPTVFADCCEDSVFRTRPDMEKLAGTTDLIGYNRYYGWYYGQPSGLGPELDKFHARYPRLPISVSEFGAGGAFTQHSDNPVGAPVNPFGRPHPEEYQSWYHEESWKEIKARPYIWASWIWNMFDFASDFRQEGEAIDLNDKGMVSFDRKRRKDSFYFYKAQWSAEPVVHITGSRYIDRAYPVADVRVYSNAPQVRLTLNGVAIGPAPCVERVCVMPGVALKAGANQIEAAADFAGKPMTDSVRWNGPDLAGGTIRIDSGELGVRRTPDGKVIGSDNFFTGGEVKQLNAPGFGRFGPKVERKVVTGPGDLALHDAWRTGAFAYQIPFANGDWTVTVHAIEPDAAQSDVRSFDIVGNGKVAVKRWSPARAAGGVLKATSISFKVHVADGRLKLDFVPVGGQPIVSAIEIAR